MITDGYFKNKIISAAEPLNAHGYTVQTILSHDNSVFIIMVVILVMLLQYSTDNTANAQCLRECSNSYCQLTTLITWRHHLEVQYITDMQHVPHAPSSFV